MQPKGAATRSKGTRMRQQGPAVPVTVKNAMRPDVPDAVTTAVRATSWTPEFCAATQGNPHASWTVRFNLALNRVCSIQIDSLEERFVLQIGISPSTHKA